MSKARQTEGFFMTDKFNCPSCDAEMKLIGTQTMGIVVCDSCEIYYDFHHCKLSPYARVEESKLFYGDFETCCRMFKMKAFL